MDRPIGVVDQLGARSDLTYDKMGNLLKRAVVAREDPAPRLTVNDQDGSVNLSLGEDADLGLGLRAGSWEQSGADYWLAKVGPDGKIYCYDPASGWVEMIAPLASAPLFNVAYFYPALHLSDLSRGTHTYYFIVDMVKNGAFDSSVIFLDQVTVNVNSAP